MIGIGTVTPLLVGLAVKFYLMSKGESTIPFSKAFYLLLPTLYWVIPFVLFAHFAYAFLSYPKLPPSTSYLKRVLIIGFGTAFGWVAMVVVFWGGWQVHGDLLLAAAPFYVGGAILLGLGTGIIVVLVSTYFEKH